VHSIARAYIFPIARITFNPKLASLVVNKYLEEEGFFGSSASSTLSAGVTASASTSASASSPSAINGIKSKLSSMLRSPTAKKGKHSGTGLDQYVVCNKPVNPSSIDCCPVCTYELKDEGMYDDAGAPRTLR
jgi:hypothetical protein